MKKNNSLAAGLFLSLALVGTNHAHEPVCTNEYGNMHCSEGEVENIHHLGNLELNGTHIKGELNVTGNINANKIEIATANTLGQFDVTEMLVNKEFYHRGIMNAQNSIFNMKSKIIGNYKGKNNHYHQIVELIGESYSVNEAFNARVTFSGKITAKTSEFNDLLQGKACEIYLMDSRTKSIVIEYESKCNNKLQLIHLDGKTIVNGDIIFNSRQGKVLLDKQSSIRGKVIGGEIIAD